MREWSLQAANRFPGTGISSVSWWWSLPHRIGPDFVLLHERAPKQYMRKEGKKSIQMFQMTSEVSVKCLPVIWAVMDVTEVVGLGWFNLVFVVAVLNDPLELIWHSSLFV